MPPIRSLPTVKPVKTERTHEENQERAYIAASRRGDRSLEARVESARRASEIHKKRTGRSLRVREEDVLNEEMYEEEDDDLPMQYRRISALHPGLAYTAFNERVNSYLAGQIGVRNYLHQAIYHANQSLYANHMFNPILLQQQQQQQQQQNAQLRPNSPANGSRLQQLSRDSPITTINHSDTRPALSHTRHSSSSTQPAMIAKSTQSPRQLPTPPQSDHSGTTTTTSPFLSGQAEDSSSPYPLTTKLPVETQQIMGERLPRSSAVAPAQLTLGQMSSIGQYNYNPNGKTQKNSESSFDPFGDTNAAFDEFTFDGAMNPMSAVSAPANLDSQFTDDMFGDVGNPDDSHSGFHFDCASESNTTGHLTPTHANWSDTDFFNYAAASD